MKIKTLLISLSILAGMHAQAGGPGQGANLHHRFDHKIKSLSVVENQFTSSPSICPMEDIDPLGSALIFNDPDALQTLFPFRKTIQRIIQSSPAPFTNPINVVQSMLSQYTDPARLNQASRVSMPLEVRPGEASLSAEALLNDTMQPTAIFNRFDLADANGAHCGEYRIIYHQALPEPSVLNRFFVIFEAQYPNPLPHLGLAGCMPIAEFWASLNNHPAPLENLERFFYRGLTLPNINMPPVIDFRHYSRRTGQIRTNNFVNNEDFIWQLREFKTAIRPEGVVLNMDTVKANPLSELYTGQSLLATQYQTDFLTVYMNDLLSPEITSQNKDQTGVITSIFLSNDNAYNEFQSDSTPGRDEPLLLASTTFQQSIQEQLSSHTNESIQALTSEMILNRAGAMSCGGCHEYSTGKEISPGVLWPNSNGFVQVSESGAISPALNDHFLPKRKEILTDFLCNPPISATVASQ